MLLAVLHLFWVLGTFCGTWVTARGRECMHACMCVCVCVCSYIEENGSSTMCVHRCPGARVSAFHVHPGVLAGTCTAVSGLWSCQPPFLPDTSLRFAEAESGC